MMKTMNYDSSFYSTPNSLRNLPGSEIKKTLTSITSKAPLVNRQLNSSQNRYDHEKHASSKIPSPRPPSDMNLSYINSFGNKNFDSFNTANGKNFPPSKVVKQVNKGFNNSNEANSGGSDAESFNVRSQHLSPHVQLKPLYKSESADKLTHVPHGQHVADPKTGGQVEGTVQVTTSRRVPTKINRNFLLKMKKKHNYKITANLSGTKFDLGWLKIYFLKLIWQFC